MFQYLFINKVSFLNDEPYIFRPTLIDLNPVDLKYYPFMISSDKSTGICNVLSRKICVPKETKDINVKAFNITTNKNEAKTMRKNISCDCKCKFSSTAYNSIQKWNNKHVSGNVQKWFSWDLRISICELNKYLKSIGDTSVIECDELVTVMDIVLTKMINAKATHVYK